jgi:hypothetical protein
MENHEKSTRQTKSLQYDNSIIQWGERCAEVLVGKTIKSVRYMHICEKKDMGWFKKSLVIFFTDGSFIFPSADNEGNDAGALFTSIRDIEVIPSL